MLIAKIKRILLSLLKLFQTKDIPFLSKNGIPSIVNSNFSSIAQIDFLAPEDLVITIETENDIKAYLHPVLDWHEIINDKLGSGKDLRFIFSTLKSQES